METERLRREELEQIVQNGRRAQDSEVQAEIAELLDQIQAAFTFCMRESSAFQRVIAGLWPRIPFGVNCIDTPLIQLLECTTFSPVNTEHVIFISVALSDRQHPRVTLIWKVTNYAYHLRTPKELVAIPERFIPGLYLLTDTQILVKRVVEILSDGSM